MSQREYYPRAAYILCLVGGIIILLVGLLAAVVGAALTFMSGGLGGFVGVFGVICGAIIIYGATQLRLHPRQRVTWGIIVIIFSFFSWVGALGGFLVGFLLALIGGILALAWSPPRVTIIPYAPQAPQSPAASASARYCPNCGRSIPFDAKFCPHCGKEIG